MNERGGHWLQWRSVGRWPSCSLVGGSSKEDINVNQQKKLSLTEPHHPILVGGFFHSLKRVSLLHINRSIILPSLLRNFVAFFSTVVSGRKIKYISDETDLIYILINRRKKKEKKWQQYPLWRNTSWYSLAINPLVKPALSLALCMINSTPLTRFFHLSFLF